MTADAAVFQNDSACYSDLQAIGACSAIRIMPDTSMFVSRSQCLMCSGTLEEMVYDRQIYKQQQANTAIEGARERRYFEGVKKVKGQEGELWGLANLFKLTAETVVTRDIIDAQRQKELNYRIETFDAAQAGE